MIKKNISSYLNLYFQEEMKFLQKEIYPYTTRMDYSTKKYRCMNIEKKNLISLIEALFWKENYKFLYKIFGIMPVRKDVKLLFDDLPEPNANREVEGIVLEKVKGFKFISSINGLDVKCKMYSTGESVEEQCKMRINIISVDNLKNNIVCHVRMKINDNIEIREIMESTDVRLICEIYAMVVRETANYEVKHENKKRKGGLGELIEERFFHYQTNNDARPDFDKAGVELKVTPYKQNKNGTLVAKEKIIPIDNIWYNGIFNTCIQFPEIRKHIADAMDISVSEQIQKLKNQFHKLISVGDAEISLDLAENFESLCVKNNYFLNNGKISLLAGDELIFDACKIKAISPSLNELELFAKWINKNTVEMLGKNYCITDKEFISFLEQMVMVMGKDEIGIQRIEKVSDATPDIESWFGSSSLAPMNEANRASIVFELIIEDKVLLFTGDSDSADWINKARDYYDLVKISHHGTTKPNLKLLESVNFDKALISTNGRKNNHPENDCLARMIMKPIKELYFNYSISQKNELVKLEPKYLFSAIFEQEIIEL